MGKASGSAPSGLDTAYGAAPGTDRKETGAPDAPAAAATDTLEELMVVEGRAREAQAERAASDARADADDDDDRRKRAYAMWEKEGRPDGRHEAHWQVAGNERPLRPDVAPGTAEG